MQLDSDVQVAADRLVQKQRIRIRREDGSVDWQVVPSLWEQLADSAGWKGNGGTNGGTGGYGSRPVIATGVVSLCAEIEKMTTLGSMDLGQQTPYQRLLRAELDAERCWDDVRLAWRRFSNLVVVPVELIIPEQHRMYAEDLQRRHEDYIAAAKAWGDAQAAAEAKRLTVVPDSLRFITAHSHTEEEQAFWAEQFNVWQSRIRAELGLDPSRPQFLRDVKCPKCEALVSSARRDGETVRVPALSVSWLPPEDDSWLHADEDWRVGGIECRECQAEWQRGEMLDALVQDVLRMNLERETVAM